MTELTNAEQQISIPLDFAWELMATVEGMVQRERLEELPYCAYAVDVRDRISKLLDPWRRSHD